jgi:protein arginine kinase activator
MSMLCQDCKKREAQVHLTQIINNEKLSLSLCKDCAAARGFHSPLDNVPFPLAEILSGLAQSGGEIVKTDPKDDLTCKICGLTFSEFTRQGRFRGRNPQYVHVDDAAALPIKEEERLETELSKAIAAEDFERAAELRDKLKTVREKVGVE